MTKETNKKLIPIAIIIAGVLIAGAVVFINQGKTASPEAQPGTLSAEQAGEKAIGFINENLLPEGMTASLVNIIEESGIYKIQIKIEDEEFPSYVTKDGKFLFPADGINLEETPIAQPETPPIEEEPQEEPPIEATVLEALAKCLTEKGMKFYGAHWCGWCNKQKELFGEAAQYLPYIECSDEETGEATSECQAAGITGFPTWELPDGTKSSGFKSPQQLAELSGCPL